MNAAAIIRNPVITAAAIFLVLTFAAPYIGIPLGLVTQIAIYSLYAVGVNLLLAYGGLAAFGSSLFFGTCGYVVSLWMLNVYPNEFIGLMAATLFAFALGAVAGAFVLRRRGLYFALLTLALSQLAYEIAFKWTW